MTPPSGQRPGAPPQAGGGRVWAPWVAAVVMLGALIAFALLVAPRTTSATRIAVPYQPVFLTQVRAGNVASVTPQGNAITGEFRKPVSYPATGSDRRTSRTFTTQVPEFADTQALDALLARERVLVSAKAPDTGPSTVSSLLAGLLPLLLIGGLVWLMVRRAGGGVSGVGRSRARRVEPTTQHMTFADVAGVEEAKEELSEIVDFLRAPEKYRKLGARIPHGVLLTGPPGTGKTLLARAMAGEAQVPFFQMSASEFVELYVGVGASRVRDLFAQAKQAAPAIVFIDELDAVGRSRGANIGGGGHEEREQTLNQILTEMDGFDPSIGVVVLSATNRPEILDSALLRPGRFDRHVAIEAPDTAGRRQILGVHTRSVPLAGDVDLDRVAAATSGMVGADLANVVNEAALLAARHGRDAVTMDDLGDALEKLILGSERRIVLTSAERRRTAYHEAGHALAAMLTPSADPVRKVSIVPHGKALGVTLSTPAVDRFSYEQSYLATKLRIGLGGRAAEELVYGDAATGAENDIRQVTELARHMVGLWGMSEAVGAVAVLPPDGQAPIPGTPDNASEATRRLVDREVHRLVETAHADVATLLGAHREQLDALVDALLRHETLDADAARTAAGIEAPAGPPVLALASAAG